MKSSEVAVDYSWVDPVTKLLGGGGVVYALYLFLTDKILTAARHKEAVARERELVSQLREDHAKDMAAALEREARLRHENEAYVEELRAQVMVNQQMGVVLSGSNRGRRR